MSYNNIDTITLARAARKYRNAAYVNDKLCRIYEAIVAELRKRARAAMASL